MNKHWLSKLRARRQFAFTPMRKLPCLSGRTVADHSFLNADDASKCSDALLCYSVTDVTQRTKYTRKNDINTKTTCPISNDLLRQPKLHATIFRCQRIFAVEWFCAAFADSFQFVRGNLVMLRKVAFYSGRATHGKFQVVRVATFGIRVAFNNQVPR
jgi:hypothetical protein